MIIVPLLFLATLLLAGEAWGRAASTESTGSGSAPSHPGSGAPPPEILCGCTSVLKTFA